METTIKTVIKKINSGDWIFNGYTYDNNYYYAIIDRLDVKKTMYIIDNNGAICEHSLYDCINTRYSNPCEI